MSSDTFFFINTEIKNQLRKTIVTSRKSALKTTLVTILTRVSLIVSLRIIFNQNFVNKCLIFSTIIPQSIVGFV